MMLFSEDAEWMGGQEIGHLFLSLLEHNVTHVEGLPTPRYEVTVWHVGCMAQVSNTRPASQIRPAASFGGGGHRRTRTRTMWARLSVDPSVRQVRPHCPPKPTRFKFFVVLLKAQILSHVHLSITNCLVSRCKNR